MAAGSLVFIDGVKEPEPNSFKKRRTSPKIYTNSSDEPKYSFSTPAAGTYKYKQPAFFVDQTLARQDSVSLQTTGTLSVKVRKIAKLEVTVTNATEGTEITLPTTDKISQLVAFKGTNVKATHDTMQFEITTTKDKPYVIKHRRIDDTAAYNEKITVELPLHITPGQVLTYDYTQKVGKSDFTILKPMTKENQLPAAIVLNAEDIDDEPNYCVCRVFVSNLFDLAPFGTSTRESVETNKDPNFGRRRNFFNFFIGKLTGSGRKHDYDR